MKTDIQIRPATLHDASVILKLCLRMHKDTGSPSPPVDENRTFDKITEVIKYRLAWVAQRDKYIIGSVGAIPLQPWWSSVWILEELWWYVLPAERHSNAAVRLFDALVGFAVENNVQLSMGTYNGLYRFKSFTRLMKAKYGLDAVGISYVKPQGKDTTSFEQT